VLTTPVVRCLKLQLDAEVHYLTKPAYRDLLASNPYIDKLHLLQDRLIDTLAALRAEQYDVVIDLHHNLRTMIVKAALMTRAYSYDKLNIQKWLMVRFKWNRLPDTHIIDRYLATCSALGVHNDGKGMDYYIADADQVAISSLPPAFAQGYVAWVIGAKSKTKQYPADKIVETLAQRSSSSLPILLVGGKEDHAMAAEIIRQDDGKSIRYNACGQYGLGGSASLLQQARAVITNDTGMMHIAAALHRPIIALWGNTIPEFGMYPYYGHSDMPSANIQVNDLKCRPCSKIGFDSCPAGHHHCMRQVDTHHILAALDSIPG
jgi:ADP-heptose:LPS heptosyltransferase